MIMLQAISWKEYFTLVGVGLVLYYGWWLVRWGPGLRMGGREMTDRQESEKKAAIPETAGLPAAAEREPVRMVGVGAAVKDESIMKAVGGKEGNDEPVKVNSPATEAAASEEGKVIVSEGTAGGMMENEHVARMGLPAVPERPVLLPLIAGDLTNEVIGLVEKAAESGMVEGELIFSFQRLLMSEPYCRLKGTTFEQRINR